MIDLIALGGRKQCRGALPSMALGLARRHASFSFVVAGASVFLWGGMSVGCLLRPSFAIEHRIGSFLLLFIVSREEGFTFSCYYTERSVVHHCSGERQVHSCISSYIRRFLYSARPLETELKTAFFGQVVQFFKMLPDLESIPFICLGSFPGVVNSVPLLIQLYHSWWGRHSTFPVKGHWSLQSGVQAIKILYTPAASFGLPAN